jgi:hypothetical protein
MVSLLLREMIPDYSWIPVQMWKSQWYVAVIQPSAGCLPPAYLCIFRVLQSPGMCWRAETCYMLLSSA